MTVRCENPNKLDLVRGIRLARAAYQSRTKGREPPPIVSARFVSRGENGADDTVLATYSAAEIKEAVS